MRTGSNFERPDRTRTTKNTDRTGQDQRETEPDQVKVKMLLAPDRTGPGHLALVQSAARSGACFCTLLRGSSVATDESNGLDRASKQTHATGPKNTKPDKKKRTGPDRTYRQMHRTFGFLFEPNRTRTYIALVRSGGVSGARSGLGRIPAFLSTHYPVLSTVSTLQNLNLTVSKVVC